MGSTVEHKVGVFKVNQTLGRGVFKLKQCCEGEAEVSEKAGASVSLRFSFISSYVYI